MTIAAQSFYNNHLFHILALLPLPPPCTTLLPVIDAVQQKIVSTPYLPLTPLMVLNRQKSPYLLELSIYHILQLLPFFPLC
jgi:hypothetical protein